MATPLNVLRALPSVDGTPMAAHIIELMPVSMSIVKVVRREDGGVEDFAIEYVNPAGAVLWEDRSEAYGEALFDVVPAFREVGLFDRYVEVLETGRPYTEEGVRLAGTYNGLEYELHLDIVVTRLDPDHIMTVFQDRTEQHHASVRLVQVQETLSRREQMERQIAAVNAGLIEDLVGVQRALDAHDLAEARRHATSGTQRAADVVSGLRDVVRAGL